MQHAERAIPVEERPAIKDKCVRITIATSVRKAKKSYRNNLRTVLSHTQHPIFTPPCVSKGLNVAPLNVARNFGGIGNTMAGM
jgi:hypothetical protein